MRGIALLLESIIHVVTAARPRLSRLNNHCSGACTSDSRCVTPPQGQVITQERELRQELKRNMLRPRAHYSRELLRIVCRCDSTPLLRAKPGTICHIVSREITLIHDINDPPPHFVTAAVRYAFAPYRGAQTHSPILAFEVKKKGWLTIARSSIGAIGGDHVDSFISAQLIHRSYVSRV